MEITWFGQSCFRIKGKNVTLVTDPYDSEMLGLKLPKLQADIVTVSHDHKDHNNVGAIEGDFFTVSGPGEYEIKGVSILGISTFHDSSQGNERGENTCYQINMDGLTLLHLGDLGHKLSAEQTGDLGTVDVLMIPVGGIYTIDGKTAAEIVTQIEPKIIIPMHFKVEGLKIDLEGVDKFLKEMGQEEVIPEVKLSITKDKLPEELKVVLLKN